ncbi:hypothetical protein DFP92_11357 [Yoonia sediminilitoris]|uniref:Uncharacterized protein n=1 Tax=Yoonia sediminilitoris TaxID=1286148 RepID=A0A2T6K9U4_9RHOB|nr:hypothetical protein C8N45_11357 [Yoonia sediminilitoris]RCW91740.1 hypothetical protein DFP92_11357 [Yoonia sediminilitoris]
MRCDRLFSMCRNRCANMLRCSSRRDCNPVASRVKSCSGFREPPWPDGDPSIRHPCQNKRSGALPENGLRFTAHPPDRLPFGGGYWVIKVLGMDFLQTPLCSLSHLFAPDLMRLTRSFDLSVGDTFIRFRRTEHSRLTDDQPVRVLGHSTNFPKIRTRNLGYEIRWCTHRITRPLDQPGFHRQSAQPRSGLLMKTDWNLAFQDGRHLPSARRFRSPINVFAAAVVFICQ